MNVVQKQVFANPERPHRHEKWQILYSKDWRQMEQYHWTFFEDEGNHGWLFHLINVTHRSRQHQRLLLLMPFSMVSHVNILIQHSSTL